MSRCPHGSRLERPPNHTRKIEAVGGEGGGMHSLASSCVGHPVDTLMLEIHIASLSHSTKRITIHKHPTMNGLEETLVDKW